MRTRYYKVTLVTDAQARGDEAPRRKARASRTCTWIRWTLEEARHLARALPGSVLSCWDRGLLWQACWDDSKEVQ